MPDFSDLFVAKNSVEAVLYKVSAPNYPHLSLDVLTDHEISALWASLTHSKLTDKQALTFVDIDSDALLYELPNAFTEALAKLTDPQLLSVASIWSEYDDIPWRRDKAQEKLKAIRTLAQQAIAEHKALFLIFI